ncbi:WD40 repeat protein [Lentzea atacamensis]|uniref:WD40 repeat protein n=1 Tax=Lentzea atacamensis TaxID=531938 RepID=A0ABX9E794_9PSEU|nr:VWA domain-containing protein [Lentzea atacamensis]RAS65549.1 WD40 repeat protein [Lentzea atacamensis]
MTVRALPLLLVALLATPVPVTRAQPAPEPEPFRIGFSSLENDNRDVFTVDSNGNARTNLTRSPRGQQDPAFSLDGTRLAYTDENRVMIANADGTSPRRLNNETRSQSQPAWSPDGTMIAAVTRIPDGEGSRPIIQIHRVSDGAKTGEIPIPGHLTADDTQPDWSPDGRTIAITRRSSNLIPPPPEIEVPDTDRPSRRGSTFDLQQVVHTPRIPPKPDVVLLIDISRSMFDELSGVQGQLRDIMEEVKKEQPETRFGVAIYAGAENKGNVFKRHQVLTSNVDDAVAAVGRVGLVEDANSTEVWANALIETATRAFEFRQDASKVVVIIGDEPTAENLVTGKDSVDNAIAELKRANIRVVGVDSGNAQRGLNSEKQIDRIIEDPKGSLQKYVKGGEEQIKTAILDGIRDLDVTVTPVPKCDTGLTVELTPPGPVTGPSGEDVTFAEKFTVSPDATPGSTLRCTIEFRLNNEPDVRPGRLQTVTVRVADLVEPLVRVNDVIVQAQNGTGATVTYLATATDSQNRPLTPVCTPPSGTVFPIGVTRVTCTATDARGNTGTDTAVVTVTSADREDPAVWLVTPDGSSQINLSERFGEPCRDRPSEDPAWSPDGKSLAVAQDGQICVVGADGSGARVVVRGTEDAERPRNPAWLPDGTRIVFQATNQELPPDLWTVAVQDGTPPRLLTENGSQPAVQRLAKLTVTTTATPAEIPFNGKTTIEVAVVNIGFAPAPATLTVTVPEGLTGGPAGGNIGPIAPGERKVVSGEATGVTAGEHVVTAAVGAITSRVTVQVLERTGSLSLALSASPQPAFVGGDDVTVTFKLLNSSGSTLTGVRVVASAFGCDPECAVGTLGPDGQAEVGFTIPATQAVDRELAGVVIATGPDENAQDNVAATRIVIKQPTLTLDQQAGPLGGVVSLQGKDFPPGAKVRLGWTAGIAETPGEVTTADGTFVAQMLVFHNDTEGIRQATATPVEGTRFGEVKSGDFLALPNTVQPSYFVERG